MFNRKHISNFIFLFSSLINQQKKVGEGEKKVPYPLYRMFLLSFFFQHPEFAAQHGTRRFFFFFKFSPLFHLLFSLLFITCTLFRDEKRECSGGTEPEFGSSNESVTERRRDEESGKKRLFEPNLEAGVDGLGQPKFYGARPARKQRRWKGERRGGWGGSGPEAIRKHSEKPDAQCLAKAISPNEPADALLIRTRRIGGVMRLSSNWTSYEPNTF